MGAILCQPYVHLHCRTRYTCHRLVDGVPVLGLTIMLPVAKCYAHILKVSVLERLLGRIVSGSRHAPGSLCSFIKTLKTIRCSVV
jgi:hypothetical protein